MSLPTDTSEATRSASYARGSVLDDLVVRALSVSLFVFGYFIVVRPLESVILLTLPLFMFIGAGIAAVGWTQRPRDSHALRVYMGSAFALSVWTLVSSISAWDYVAFYRWRYVSFWLLFIVPGVAFLLRYRRQQQAFVAGLLAGAAVLGAIAVSRLLRTGDLFDVQPAGAAPYPEFMGVNRNLRSTVLLAVLPFVVLAPLPKRFRVVRAPLVAMIGAFVLFSGSRGALISLTLALLTFAVVQPTGTRTVRVLYVTLLSGIVLFVAIEQIGGQAAVSRDRLTQSISGEGEESEGDEVRRLVLRKAWAIALEHPVVGKGLGSFRVTESDAADVASTERVYELANYEADHNAYAGLMAEGGFPAFVFFAAMFLTLLREGFRARASPAARAAIVMFAVVLFALFFGLTHSDPIVYCSLALMLGAILQAHAPAEPEEHVRTPALARLPR